MPARARRLLVMLLLALPPLALPPPVAGMPERASATLIEAHTGVLLGSATPLGGDRVLTSRHVVEPALRRGVPVAVRIAGSRAEARIAALSDRLDLAVLVAERALAPAPPVRAGLAAPGTPVAAASPRGTWVRGEAMRFAWREEWGPAAFARLPVGFGFSGGPLIDAEGRLLGLVTAAVNPSARQLTALRSDPTRPSEPGIEPPVVFVLPIGAVLDEARRIDPDCCRLLR